MPPPFGWEATTLGEIATFIRGINFKPDDVVPVGTPGSVACMRTKNVQADLDDSDVWAVSESLVKRQEQFLRSGDILVSSANSWNLVGKCCWVPELPWLASFGGFVSVLRPKDSVVDRRFLYRWFSSDRVQATVRSFGQQTTSISNLNIQRCKKLVIPLPPLHEQRRIAQVLDRAEGLRAKRRTAIKQLETLRQSIFLDMIGGSASGMLDWPMVRLEDILSGGPQNGLYKPSATYGAGAPIVRIDSFYDGVITKLAALKRVAVSDVELERYGLRPGDILVNRVNSREFLGKTALVPDLSEPTIFESNMMRVSADEDQVEPRYLVDTLRSSFIRGQIMQATKDAVNQASINQQDLKRFVVPLPPVTVQRDYVRMAQRVDLMRDQQQVSAAALAEMFSSLRESAVRGHL